jgi:hydroxyethylthiazole kinase-like uncharacterized protein yjeF
MIELLTAAEMAEADRLTIASGTPGIELMERAGLAVADAAANLQPSSVVVVAGTGNNGGDGYVAARILAERGHRVRVLQLGDRNRIHGDAALAAARWTGAVEPAVPGNLTGAGAIIDAIFGAGLDRPVEGVARAIIEAINAQAKPVVAVDLPSGIDGTTGKVMGAAVMATRTVTFFRKKPGHLLFAGRQHCGKVSVADIGIASAVLEKVRPQTWCNDPALWMERFPVPQIDGHKYTRGHAVVVSGGMSTTGAARLAARGALRAGAGLVTIASPRDALAVNAASNVAVMVRTADGAAELSALLADARFNAVVVGPGVGVGQATRDRALAALDGRRAVVLDADVLTSFVDDVEALATAIKDRSSRHPDARPVVLTPHEGEFTRLARAIATSGASSKLDRARQLAAYAGAIVVLKGADTVIADAAGRAAINGNAPPWLATAGTGDVLAGMIAGLLAQGMEGFSAAAAAVWLHGATAELHGAGLISEDLPELLPRAVSNLLSAFRRDGSIA